MTQESLAFVFLNAAIINNFVLSLFLKEIRLRTREDIMSGAPSGGGSPAA